MMPGVADIADSLGGAIIVCGPYTDRDRIGKWWMVSRGIFGTPGTVATVYWGQDEAEARKVFKAEAERLRNE